VTIKVRQNKRDNTFEIHCIQKSMFLLNVDSYFVSEHVTVHSAVAEFITNRIQEFCDIDVFILLNIEKSLDSKIFLF
jgi:hypothetical protein